MSPATAHGLGSRWTRASRNPCAVGESWTMLDSDEQRQDAGSVGVRGSSPLSSTRVVSRVIVDR